MSLFAWLHACVMWGFVALGAATAVAVAGCPVDLALLFGLVIAGGIAWMDGCLDQRRHDGGRGG